MKLKLVDSVNHSTDPNPNQSDVFELIHAIMHLFRSQQYREFRTGPHEITHLEGKLIGFFARQPGATLSELVAYYGRDKGQLARLIKNLRKVGLLSNHDGEKKDRRTVHLHLTPQGEAVHKALHRQTGRIAEIAVHGLSKDERYQLTGLLKKVRGNLEANRQSDA